ncbi:MAG: PRC-barrel domain-containing protein [Methylacidiphilales bacterium]|nr:PRC-barrel domain-containing protein [Candidatus Methylacidiphilales bacterium]
MLQNIKKLYGIGLHALDGKIGHVQDFYFDDQDWTVRYVIADTGSWLSGRQVLLSPHAFGSPQEGGRLLQVNLTREQIENSPSIESHMPVSRQYEEEYHRYYGWPCYWQGGGLWGPNAIPILETPREALPDKTVATNGSRIKGTDEHLRSTLNVDGYRLEARDGKIGHVCNFMMDAQSWAIKKLVIKTGHWLAGKEVEIPTSEIERISYDESTVFVNLTGKMVELSPWHRSISGDAEITATESIQHDLL